MSEVADGRISIQCETCGQRFRVRADAAGRKGACPKCRHAFIVPATESAAASAAASGSESIRFQCETCGAALKARAAAAGKRVRCKACGAVQAVPAAESAHTDAAAGDDMDLLGALSGGQAVAEDPGARVALMRCPSCGFSMPASQSACPSCGHDARGGRPGGGPGVAVAARSAAGALGRVAFIGGGFPLGCILSAVGVLMGAIAWCVIALMTGYQLGFVAWGIGLLAGGGMLAGMRGHANMFGGLVAAGVSVLGILMGKAMIALALAGAVSADRGLDDEEAREWLALLMATVAITQANEDDSMPAVDFEEAHDEAYERVADMGDDEVRNEIRRLHEMHPEAVQGMQTLVAAGFMVGTFGCMDVLFFGLAILTAFKIGAGGFGGD